MAADLARLSHFRHRRHQVEYKVDVAAFWVQSILPNQPNLKHSNQPVESARRGTFGEQGSVLPPATSRRAAKVLGSDLAIAAIFKARSLSVGSWSISNCQLSCDSPNRLASHDGRLEPSTSTTTPSSPRIATVYSLCSKMLSASASPSRELASCCHLVLWCK